MTTIAQHKWRWCGQCQCLWYSAASQKPKGACPGTTPPGGPHSEVGSGDYALFNHNPTDFNPTIMAQPQWRWCSQCGSLWHPTSASPHGACPGTKPTPGGPHTESGSGDYALLNDSSGNMG